MSTHHASNNVQSSHSIHNTKSSHQALLQAPTDNNIKSNSNINNDEPDTSKDYSNHSSGNYERKKNPQNPNRKHFGSGTSYRGNTNSALNNHNSLAGNSINQTNSLSANTTNIGMRKVPLIHQNVSESNGMMKSFFLIHLTAIVLTNEKQMPFFP